MLGQVQSATLSLTEAPANAAVRAATHERHALHHPDRDWPQTNCYVDLWIELLATRGVEPEAMLGFTIAQDFDGDQFTFFKPRLADLELLYSVRVEELALYDRTEHHIERQIARGGVVLVEVDGFYLPDTRGVTYRLDHSKTTIGVDGFDLANRRMDYFHNDGLFALDGEDFDGVLGRLPEQEHPAALFPYAEFARFDRARESGVDLRDVAEELLRTHFGRRPQHNPLRAFAAELPFLWNILQARPPCFFHAFAFNTFRQLGANFELLGSHLAWLRRDGSLAAETGECRLLSSNAKALQFQAARASARKRPLDPSATLEEMASAYDRLIEGIANALKG